MRVSSVKNLVAVGTALLASCSSAFTSSSNVPAAQRSGSQARKACPCLYVANNSSITVYAVGATRDAKPVQAISGSKTELGTPLDVAVDASGKMYVTNYNNYSVTVYVANASGNFPPRQTIIGGATGLMEPEGIAVDPVSGNIYVANHGGPSSTGSVTIYSGDATGNAAPLGTIAGTSTGVDDPTSIALDAAGNIYVANAQTSVPKSGGSITVFAAGSVGNVAPMQTITGPQTGLTGPTAVAVDDDANIYIAEYRSGGRIRGSVLVYAAGSSGNVAPTRTISGHATKLIFTLGVAVDSIGNIYASNYNQNEITVYAPGANGDVRPTKEIDGSQTGLYFPVGVSVR